MDIKFIKYIQIPPPKCVKRLLGFTLSEVLLTLTILGVVISLTVPTLLNNVQQNQENVAVWQADNMLSQAVEQLQANNGIVNVTSNTGLRSDLCSVLQCVRTDTTANIYSSISNPFYYSYYKGSYWANNYASDGSLGAILSNGMVLFDIYTYGNCNNGGVNACASIPVDINGPAQGPNMLGEDVYVFWVVLNNGVYSILPFGTANDTVAGPGRGQSCQVGNWACGCTYQRLYNPNNMP